jgi:hypothetical protein
MAISKDIRDQLLVEARHRCTICAERCFEIHHIIEQAKGGSDAPDNLIVLCPNCHQHRYHRTKEFSKDQLYLYKAKLKEQNEIEKRLLLNLEEIRIEIGNIPLEESERKIRQELQDTAKLITQDNSPTIHAEVMETSRWLAERDLIRSGARKAIEIEWEVQRQRESAMWSDVSITKIDEDAWVKASDFEGAYKLVFILDRVPASEWNETFVHHFEHSRFPMKRRTYIQGNRMIMIVADSDNLQDHADNAKQLVKEVNDIIKSQVLPRLNAEIERRKQTALQIFDTIQSLKSRTKDIKL